MKKSILLLLVVFTLTRCSEEQLTVQDQLVAQQEPLTESEINQIVIQKLEQNNEFKWEMVNSTVLWSALVNSDSMLVVGYQPEGEGNISGRVHQIDINDKDWSAAKSNLLDEVVSSINKKGLVTTSQEEVLFKAHDVLPFFKIKVWDIEVVNMLRAMPSVRYVEPVNYGSGINKRADNGKTESSSGCSNSANYGIPTADYTVVAPNAKASWNYDYMNIRQAWSYSTGAGISVGLIDTGISPNQNKLNSQFNTGYSQGRFVHKYGTYVSSWWPWASPDGPNDKCGHGTAMAGIIAAPRSAAGSAVGVAYNSNLVAYRGTSDVVVNGYDEIDGVADALVGLGNRSDVKIISMSIGDIFWHSEVADGVRYAYGKGKMLISAAGTSFSWTNWVGVIFPANMSETIAVTGIKDNGYNECSTCHYGSQVDFSVVMQRSSNGNTALSLAMSGDTPSTVGGSSAATATTAGIAALIWARNPSMTRSQVLQKMKDASDLYPSRNANFGWGKIDALQAVQ
jgi:serine protease